MAGHILKVVIEETPVDSFLLNNKWIRYTYDFGDEWHHKIIYEKTDETYGKRYAALLKFKGDNFLEDSGGVWGGGEEEWENRSPFDPVSVAEELKGLICPVCDHSIEPTREINPKNSAVSQMTNKIDAWKEFVEAWEEGTAQKSGNTWEIIVPESENEKPCGKTNHELLQALSYKEAKDYCKYLQIPVLETWTKEQLVRAVADTFAEHPEYFLYVFYKDEYADFMKLMKLPCGERQERPTATDSLIKGAALGLVDISVVNEENRKKAKLTFALDLKSSLLSLSVKERNAAYRKLESVSDNLRSLILFYGIVELEALYKIYCQVYGETMDRTQFNRYVYWHGRFNNLILTATSDKGISYAASPEVDLDVLSQRMEKYAGDLEYIVYSKKELKKMADDIGERSEWLGMLFTYLHFHIGLPETIAGSIVEGIFGCVMNGDTLSFVMRNLEETLDALGFKPDLVSKCEIWQYISGLMLELELPMLKGRSRNRYAEEKEISPWTVGMCEAVDGKMKSNSRTKRMHEFPPDIQEMMQSACSFVDRDAIKRLMCCRKKGKIRSEEFLFLLADALITGCEFEQARDVLLDLESGSKQARKAADQLRMLLEQGEDVVDEPWEPMGESWDFMEPLQKPYVRTEPKIGRNDPCPCGSGKKYKHCCGK